MNVSTLAVIPARIGSTRLPAKPLTRIAGRPLIEWVWRRARTFEGLAELVIATDSAEVAEVATGFGARVEMTRTDHPSGTDRVAEVVRRPAYAAFPLIINLQGDEPFASEAAVQAALAQVRGPWEIGTAALPIRTVAEWRDPSTVKVVRNERGGALLFTRAPVPHPRDGMPTDAGIRSGPFLRHLGIYAYRRDALLRWVALPESPLERLERLEQLRPLAAGLAIGVAVLDGVPEGPGIDTPADVALAEQLLSQPSPVPA